MKASAESLFSEYTPRRASNDIANQIRDVILSEELKEGDRLPTEGALAAQFNVSRMELHGVGPSQGTDFRSQLPKGRADLGLKLAFWRVKWP